MGAIAGESESICFNDSTSIQLLYILRNMLVFRSLHCASEWELSGGRQWKKAFFLLYGAAKLLQLCPTPCNPIDGSPPGSPIPGVLQARILERVVISFSNAWKWKVKVKSLSHVWLLATSWTAAHQAPPTMGFSKQEYWSGVPLPLLYRHFYISAYSFCNFSTMNIVTFIPLHLQTFVTCMSARTSIVFLI